MKINTIKNTGLKTLIATQLGKFNLKVDAVFSSQNITGILGPSGCGKTSLLKAVAGFLGDDVGIVQWRQKNWQGDGRFCPIEKRHIGFISQHSDLFPHLNAEQNLDYGFKRLAPDQRQPMQARKLELIQLLSLQDLLHRQIDTLSGGEKQRLALARALVSAPSLLLMDEPLSAVDEASKPAILTFIRELNRRYQIPLLYVSHSFDEISYLADDLLLMGHATHSSPMPIDQALLENPRHPALRGPVVILDVDIGQAHAELGYTDAVWAGHALKIPLNCAARLRLRASDIVICTSPPQASSALNLFKAQISAIDLPPGLGSCLVSLKVNQQALLATITPYSLQEMQLKAGQTVFLQVKASSFW